MMENRDISVQRVVSRIPNLAINEQYLLMNLEQVVKTSFLGHTWVAALNDTYPRVICD